MHQTQASLLLRLSLAASLLSAVASRLGFWGIHSSGWKNFVTYTAQVNSFAPRAWAPVLAVAATILESSFGLLLLVGFKTSQAARGAALLTACFALAMSISFGIKEPLDYAVWVFSAGSFLLSTQPVHPFSIDELFNRSK